MHHRLSNKLAPSAWGPTGVQAKSAPPAYQAQEDAAEEKKRAEEEAEAQKRRDEIFQVLLREEMGEAVLRRNLPGFAATSAGRVIGKTAKV